MSGFTRIFGIIALLATALSVSAAHTQARLLLPLEEAQPGQTILAGVQLKMDSGWHTYWRNAGDSGDATSIDWSLPEGVEAGEVQWPVPEKYVLAEFTTYVYHDETILLVPLKLAESLEPGPIELKAQVSWLECEEVCIPGDAEVGGALVIAEANKPSPDAGLIEAARSRLPAETGAPEFTAQWQGPAVDDERIFEIQLKSDAGDEWDFFPYKDDDFEVTGKTERADSSESGFALRKSARRFGDAFPSELSGILVRYDGETRRPSTAFEVSFALGGGVSAGEGLPEAAAVDVETPGFGLMLLYAFLGGLILNIMPCVLPVIALKILSFVKQANEEPGRVRRLSWIFTLGVLVSFLALALIVIGLKAAGGRVGWGFQFSNPYFLVAMTTLVTLIALNLFGVFEVTLGGGAMIAATELTGKSGAAGAFFNGLLATLLATSCSAPLLGAAIGFAFAQPPLIILGIMLMVGVGLAAPYIVLSFRPEWLRYLPKPGLWMERFKVAMGFPMLAAAVWLFSLLTTHYGDRSWWLGIFLVLVALAAWVFGEFVQRSGKRRGLAIGMTVVLLATAYWWVLDRQMRWRTQEIQTASTASTDGLANAPKGYDWQPWSREAVARARSQGRPVVVDFTAKWCITCNAIVKPAFESASVRKKMEETSTVALLADYTDFPPDVHDELARFGRAAVPLVVVYPADRQQATIILPEALTPGMIVNALEQAAGG